MDVGQFIAKWKASTLKERSASQEHFIDLCHLLGHPTPADADPDGTWFTFEKGAKKTGGGDGWADVWKRGCFAWEYKGKHKDLDAAYAQLQRYAVALENPPLLVVSDMETFIIYTNWTNTVQQVRRITLEDLRDSEPRKKFDWLFNDPERLKPTLTRDRVTEEAAKAFAALAQSLRGQGYEPHRVAHFVTKLLFCMFAEDIGILPKTVFTKILEAAEQQPDRFGPMIRSLFAAMRHGGQFGYDAINWFNGGLFDDEDALPLTLTEIKQALVAARMDWSDIEPSIFGTLFERGLDPGKRAQLGAHYTDRGSIMRLVNPVVLEPLEREWEEARAKIEAQLAKAEKAKKRMEAAVQEATASMDKDAAGKAVKAGKAAETKASNEARAVFTEYLARLAAVRVLDPACGSGNFLYLSLLALKDLEHRVNLEAEALGLEPRILEVGPPNVLGIELNPYAAELARVTIWIGEIQWTLRHGYGLKKDPILKPLDQIDCRDAIIAEDGTEPEWPEAEFIVGNPPFLGDKKQITELGEDYVTRIRALYKGRVSGGADLVTYWFEKVRQAMKAGSTVFAGLVATNSIRAGKNRLVLQNVASAARIVSAWSDEPWINEGAAVRVSIVAFGPRDSVWPGAWLNGARVSSINPDLTEGGFGNVDMTTAKVLRENKGRSFIGMQKSGPFEVPGELARSWLLQGGNPNRRPNSEVLKPYVNGKEITSRPRDTWIIDCGVELGEAECALFEKPFEYIIKHVKPMRERVRRDGHRRLWWRFGEPRPGMRNAVAGLKRVVATPMVSKHRFFVWFDTKLLPDQKVVLFPFDNEVIFGVLSSKIHTIWTLATCSWIGKGNDPTYSSTTTFETFPFPEALTPNIPAEDYAKNPRAIAIAEAARRLVKLRDNWLNPPEWVERVPEVVAGYPDRLVPVDEEAAKQLKKRTLTNLYNQRPAWLHHAHEALDAAVAAAYGWEPDIADSEVLRRVLELNLQRASAE